MVCVFWDFNWMSSGCNLIDIDSNRGSTICECNHLTNFAAILDISGTEYNEYPKSLLTDICCGLSILTLVLTILLKIIKRKKINDTKIMDKTNNMIICNLCICLLITDLLIVFAMDKTENKVNKYKIEINSKFLNHKVIDMQNCYSARYYIKFH
jgi:hypothetical protein